MKKLFLALAILAMAAGMAYADYSVTVTYDHSTGPNLQNEKIYLDGVEQCDILAASPATCTFIVTDLAGQEVSGQAFNIQSTGSVVYVFGNLLSIPAPPSGGIFTITQIP